MPSPLAIMAIAQGVNMAANYAQQRSAAEDAKKAQAAMEREQRMADAIAAFRNTQPVQVAQTAPILSNRTSLLGMLGGLSNIAGQYFAGKAAGKQPAQQ